MYIRYFAMAFFAGVLHYIWEVSHIHLYTGYEALGSGTTLLVWATAGDILYSLLGVIVVGALYRDFDWLKHPHKKQFILVAVYGCIVAIGIEWKALIMHRWAYTIAMPIVPFLNVGLSPIVQMSIIVPISCLLAFIVSKKFISN